MAKINATYGSGYYLAPDVDYRRLEEQQRLERKRKKVKGEAVSPSERDAIRQTFAMPFNVICLHCNCRIARGAHGYVNRRATDETYMGIRIWELEIRCMFCKGHIYLKTDYETAKLTGGYHCSRNCRRGEGDFYGTNQINEEVKAQRAAEKADEGTVDALERENEVMLQLQERERLVEELVEARAGTEEAQTRDELLQVIRARKQQGALMVGDGIEGEFQSEAKRSAEEEEEEMYQRFEAQLRLWGGEGTSSWREQHDQQQRSGAKKGGGGEEEEVTAALIARYAGAEGKYGNVFVDDSEDSNDDDREGKSVPLPSATTTPLTTSPSTSANEKSNLVSVLRKGSALASLLDD